jgi:hypothetical protein
MGMHARLAIRTASIGAWQTTIADSPPALNGRTCHNDVAVVPPMPETL